MDTASNTTSGAPAVPPATFQSSIERFIRRLNASITRSPLLKVSPRRTGRLIDISRFYRLGGELPETIVEVMVTGEGNAALDFDLRELRNVDTTFAKEEDEEAIGADPRLKEQRSLFSQLESVRRTADLARRETGVHALWMGYPLLYLPSGPNPDDPWILAPVFLFPSVIAPNIAREGRINLRRSDVGPPRFNTALAAWIQRMLAVELPRPTEDDLDSLNLASVDEWINQIAQAFQPPPTWDETSEIIAVPSAKSLSPRAGAQFLRCAVLGIFRWQNEAILADLEALRTRDDCPGTIRHFLAGDRAEALHVGAAPPEADRYLVTDADFSQQRVVWRSRDGRGIVVHGPPGTGKSQTIVNIIADALAHGQTVLMVCQKEAATRVVAKRLEQAGLCGRDDHRDLVIELHDAETDRQAIFKDIRTQVESIPATRPASVGPRRTQISREIERLEANLDAFAKGMHEKHPQIGLAYREVLAQERRFFNDMPQVRPLSSLSSLGERVSADELNTLVSTARQAGELFYRSRFLTNPWRHRVPTFDLTPSVEAELTSLLLRCDQLDAEHQRIIRDSGGPGLTLPARPAQFREHAEKVVTKIRQECSMPPLYRSMLAAWLALLPRVSEGDLQRLTSNLDAASALADHVARHPIDTAWQNALQGCVEVDRRTIRSCAEMLLSVRTKWWRYFLQDFWRARRVIRARRPDAIGNALFRVASECVSYFTALEDRQRLLESTKSAHPKITSTCTGPDDAVEFVRTAKASFESARRLLKTIHQHSWVATLAEPLFQPDTILDETLVVCVTQAVRRCDLAEGLIRELRKLKQFLEEPVLAALESKVLAGTALTEDIARIRDGVARLEALRSIEGLLAHTQGASGEALASLLSHEEAAARGEQMPRPEIVDSADTQGRWWSALVGHSIAAQWRTMIRQRHPILDTMSPDDAERTRESLAQLLKEKRDLETRVILDLWHEGQQRVINFPWQAVFKLRGARGSPAPKLREAVHHSIRNGLLDLRPCWLTNPTAAAQVFPLEEGLFDVIIFDEASQCPIEQAIPALCRGKRAIIAGDEKQLPPTSFFSPDDDGQSDECEEEVEVDTPEQSAERLRKLTAANVAESEDLLKAAIGVLPEEYLLVHYRSEHPALIEFSNRAFYAGRLEMPPARTIAKASARPIEYIAVGGLYDRRVNQREAATVVQIIKEIITGKAPTPTIGVVTFNQPQRNLIQDLLETERLRDPVFKARYDEELNRREDNQDASLFVKNLENVQGDERDVMLFSTTFGRNSEGKFYRNFGPVTREGGERRLNVAVTRAKKRVIVVGSMPIDEITPLLHDGSGPGSSITTAAYLQFYLAYARAIHAADENLARRVLERLGGRTNARSVGEFQSPLEEEVYEAITHMGYTVHTQVGESGFAIDLAVLHPDPTLGYVLGIECDGAAYHSDRSARIRDVWRQEILSRRGWTICRVWSTRWWQRKGDEIERLRRELDMRVSR